MEIKYLNSAGRLLAILQNLKEGEGIGHQLVPIMLGLDSSTGNNISIDGVKALTELHNLYATFLQDIEDADLGDDERAVLQNGLTSLESLMYPLAVNQGARKVSEAEKALLEVCATRLQKESPISKEDIAEIRKSIDMLKETIEENTTSEVLRTILLELVRLSEDSLNRYNIYGAKGLKRAFKNMLSEVAEIYLQDKESEGDIKKSVTWTKLIAHLKLFDSVASKTLKYRPLLEKASQFLIGN
tara:strand:- start:1595 stop:2323 length:729 start_codon:yes stop_codon:yes gene_type:complete